MCVSYVPKKNGSVILISSMHDDMTIDTQSGMKKNPETTFYNQTKFGIDVVDQMVDGYNEARTPRRWTMIHLFNLINSCGRNARSR